MTSLSRAFAALTPDGTLRLVTWERWRAQMLLPAHVRAYHTEAHIEAVLNSLRAWTNGGEMSRPLLAAAVYHDVVYDPVRKDNEAQSAAFCRTEMEAVGLLSAAEIAETVRLIELTAGHIAEPGDTDGTLLLDADLFVLGDTPENYAAYVRAIRTEYAHVSPADWRIGRAAVMGRFLERERIYQGTWDGHENREKQARLNIAGEIASLE